MNIQFLFQLISANWRNNDDEGLTTMELIAVIIMMMIVIFFTLPSLLNYGWNSSIHIHEAKAKTGGMNYTQQQYLIRK
jgi:hypothetical protein